MSLSSNDKIRLRNKADHKRRVLARWKRVKGCTDCGYKENSDALELDHKPGEKKRQTVASLMYQSWEVIKSELAKCEVRCCNCHAIRTQERKRLSAIGGNRQTHLS